MRHAYMSKYNLTRENQVILLMITHGEKWHYLAVKSLSALFGGITGVMLFPLHIFLIIIKDTMTFYLCP